ncbi:hypothetical protein L1987_13978 [Smallanthus sonchifolius]|uniref:Uncharacterized protein n=1 Tax=Smallanthus sonchifolius TaxID=185202 RepID=A0ACB9JK38_9ASTR|nr:hypothetical protein L1987_13978 [Smallanthus sonchifolius]
MNPIVLYDFDEEHSPTVPSPTGSASPAPPEPLEPHVTDDDSALETEDPVTDEELKEGEISPIEYEVIPTLDSPPTKTTPVATEPETTPSSPIRVRSVGAKTKLTARKRVILPCKKIALSSPTGKTAGGGIGCPTAGLPRFQAVGFVFAPTERSRMGDDGVVSGSVATGVV